MSTHLKLTVSQQRYLETIHNLCENHGHAHVKAIADALGYKMPTITEAIANLAEKGMVNYQVRKSVTLTEDGKRIALVLDENHQTLADFFKNILGVPSKRAEEIACGVEHVIDSRFRHRLAEFVRFLKEDIGSQDDNPILKFKKRYVSPKTIEKD